MLKKEPSTIEDIATHLNMTRQGARYLVKELVKENMVKAQSLEKIGNLKFGTRKYCIKVI